VTTERTLVVIVYPDDSIAQGAIAALERLSIEELIDLDDVAYARRDSNGHIAFHETRSGPGGGIRKHLAHPFRHSGVQQSAEAERYARLGITDAYIDQLDAELGPDGAALFLLVHRPARERVIAEMSKFGGTVVKSSLPPETEEALKAALSGTEPPVS
jgi:uncharacterized membrane protein